MGVRNTRRLLVGLLLIWCVALGHCRLLAAEEESKEPVLKPIPEGEPVLESPEPGRPLDLLESSSDAFSDGGYPDCAEGGFYEEPYSCMPYRFWIRPDYLVMWTKGSRLPPLVTTSPVGAPIGVLGEPTTAVLFGGSNVNRGGRSNVRVTFGAWLDCYQRLSWETDYYDSGGESTGFSQFSSGDPVLARPFYDVVNQQQSSLVVAYPGLVVGSVEARASDYFESTGTWLRRNLCCFQQSLQPWRFGYPGPTGGEDGCGEDTCCADPCCVRTFRLDLIAGYRHYGLNDSVMVRDTLISTQQQGTTVIPGTVFYNEDVFRATNEFHGGELGLVARWCRCGWTLDLSAKMALGNNNQFVSIDGRTVVTVPGQAPVEYEGGLLALQSNIGRYERDDFVVVPQFGAEVGYQLRERLRAYVGYNFLYWANVARAGEQIDLRIDPRNMPPVQQGATPYPAFSFNGSDFWAHGLTVGCEVWF